MAKRTTAQPAPAPVETGESRALRVEMTPVTAIRPYPGNPRRPRDALRKVMASIEKYGFQQPIVVDKDMVIIVGHTRYQAALRLGHATVPVTVASNLDEAQARAYRIEDNRTGAEAEFDLSMLQIELSDLAAKGIELISLGFDPDDLDKLAALEGLVIDDEPKRAGKGRADGLGTPVISYQIVFENETQQGVWFDFLRMLKRTMPELETIGARLARHVESLDV